MASNCGRGHKLPRLADERTEQARARSVVSPRWTRVLQLSFASFSRQRAPLQIAAFPSIRQSVTNSLDLRLHWIRWIISFSGIPRVYPAVKERASTASCIPVNPPRIPWIGAFIALRSVDSADSAEFREFRAAKSRASSATPPQQHSPSIALACSLISSASLTVPP